MSKKPNLLLFNPDQWRGDHLGHAGHPAARTPVLDRCVETDFVSFTRAFCQNPVCTPSRCSFMTGWYPHVRGHRTMHFMLQPDEPMLLRRLKEEGYFVWWGGKNDVVPAENGFSAFCDVKYQVRPEHRDLHAWKEWRGAPEGDNFYSFYGGRLEKGAASLYLDADWCYVQGAIDAIHEHARSGSDQPLCLYLPLAYPHPPYAVEEPYYSLISREHLPPRIPGRNDPLKPAILSSIRKGQRLTAWDDTRWDELRATYLGMCARVDHQFGLVLQALRDAGMYDDTAVFFFSDHGDFTGDYGLVEKTQNTFEDCLTRVPFLFKPPQSVGQFNGMSEALVELVDLPATVFDLLDLEPGYAHFGHSLVPLAANTSAPGREAVFCEGGRLPFEWHCSEAQSVTDSQDLYWPRLAAQTRSGPDHCKAIMCRTQDWKYVRRLGEEDELYDLNTDPGEQNNLIQQAQYAPVLAALKERLLTWLLETADVVPYTANRR